jgi:hypothetical protein
MNNENGSSSLTLLAGTALFFTSMYVVDGSRKTTQTMASAKISNS